MLVSGDYSHSPKTGFVDIPVQTKITYMQENNNPVVQKKKHLAQKRFKPQS